MSDNPYNPNRHRDLAHEIERELAEELAKSLRRGGGHMLLGGHGSGKSTTLTQLERGMGARSDVSIFRFARPPQDSNDAHRRVARKLSVEQHRPDAPEAIEIWLQRNPARFLVLLFDEFSPPSPEEGRVFFNALEPVIREEARLAVLAAGGVQMMRLKVQGALSPFWSRAVKNFASPFSRTELDAMAARFRPLLPPPCLDRLYELSGGNAYLITFALQQLWERADRSAQMVEQILEKELFERGDFVQTFHQVLEIHEPLGPVRLVWDHLIAHRGEQISRQALAELCRQGEPDDFEASRVLDFLQASGLIRYVRGARGDEHITVEEVASSVLRPMPLPPEEVSRARARIARPRVQALLQDMFTQRELDSVLAGDEGLGGLCGAANVHAAPDVYFRDLVAEAGRQGLIESLLVRCRTTREARIGEIDVLLHLVRGES